MAERLTLKELQAAYKKEAKRADQRMRELERRSTNPQYKAALEWSYARAQDDLSALFGENVTRFDRKIDDRIKLNKAMAAVKAFLNSETSTIGKGKSLRGIGETQGIAEMYDKRATAFNSWIRKNTKSDFQFTTEQFEDFVKNRKYQKLRQADGSDVILRRVANRMKDKNKIVKMIQKEQHRAKNKITDRMVYNYILREIEEKGFSAAKDLL